MANKIVSDFLLGQFDESLFEISSDQYLDLILQRPMITKDFQLGALYKISKILPFGKDKITITTEEHGEISVQLRKEKEYLKIIGVEIDEFIDEITKENPQIQLPTHVMTVKYGAEMEGTLIGAHILSLRQELYQEIKDSKKVYTAHVLERNKGGFLVEVNGLKGFLPGSLAAANRIIDFDVYLDTIIPVMV